MGAWAVLVIAGALSGLSSPLAMSWASLILHPMTLEFILGAVAGLAITKGYIWRSGILTLVATLWLLAALCYQGQETAFQLEWGRVLWYGLPAALLVYAVAGLDMHERHAWLIPAMTGWLVTLFLFNLTGLDGDSPASARRDATLLTVTVGGIGMMIVIWFGWLLGQGAPDQLRRTKSFFRIPVLNAAVKLGDWSFALYLSHLIVLSALRRIFGHARPVGQPRSGLPAGPSRRAGQCCLCGHRHRPDRSGLVAELPDVRAAVDHRLFGRLR